MGFTSLRAMPSNLQYWELKSQVCLLWHVLPIVFGDVVLISRLLPPQRLFSCFSQSRQACAIVNTCCCLVQACCRRRCDEQGTSCGLCIHNPNRGPLVWQLNRESFSTHTIYQTRAHPSKASKEKEGKGPSQRPKLRSCAYSF